MRDIIIAGNWKMNKGLGEAVDFAERLKQVAEKGIAETVLPIIAPAFPLISHLAKVFEGSKVMVAAQDVSAHKSGAFTGEVSAEILASLGVPYCIVGHSERRSYHGESCEIVREKLLRLIDSGIKPILCIGETLAQREEGQTEEIILGQLENCLSGIGIYSGKDLIIAYEPVWAIGTGRTATGKQAQEAHSIIRNWLAERYSHTLAEALPILYGGSVKPYNIEELLLKPDIDGGLIGGASLEIDSYLKMLDKAINLNK